MKIDFRTIIKATGYCLLLSIAIWIIFSYHRSTLKVKDLKKEIEFLHVSLNLCNDRSNQKIEGAETAFYPAHNFTYSKYNF
jgi:hypothetical protein